MSTVTRDLTRTLNLTHDLAEEKPTMSEPVVDLAATAPCINDYTNGERRVRLIGMQHVAQPGYYDAAAEEVRSAKTGGYVHFYEFVDMYELDDTGQRKVRRVTQSLPMPELYATLAEALGKELGLTPGGIATRSAAWVGGRSGYQRRSLVGGVPTAARSSTRTDRAPTRQTGTPPSTGRSQKACRQSDGWRRSSTAAPSRSQPRCTSPITRRS
jgi:hypothetical protein